MAKPDKMPQQAIIDGFKHIIDFYYWKGIAVARRWPRYFARTPSPQEAVNQADFAYINKLYSTLPAIVLQGLIDHAKGTTQVPKDYLVRAYLKGLFELMPPDYYMTEATGLAILAQLELIAELRDALASIATDRLQVEAKGGDKLFSLETVVNEADTFPLAGGSIMATSGAVPGTKVWVITAVAVRNNTRAATSYHGGVNKNGTEVYLMYDPDGEAQYFTSTFSRTLYLDAGDKIFFEVGGGQDGDVINIFFSGYQMDQP